MTLRSRVLALCAWVAANALGVGAYLFFASTLWIKPGEESELDSLGNAFYWMSHSVPLLALFLVTNTLALIALRKSKDTKVVAGATVVFRALAVVWILIVLFDKYRSQ